MPEAKATTPASDSAGKPGKEAGAEGAPKQPGETPVPAAPEDDPGINAHILNWPATPQVRGEVPEAGDGDPGINASVVS